jgi:hypothetical protein
MTAGARYSLPGINLLRGSAADVVLLAQAAGALTALIGQRVGLVILATALFVSFPLAMLVTWQLLTHPEHEPQPHLEQLDGLASIGISLRQRARPIRHLERVLDEYVDHYNSPRPHRGLRLHPPNGQVHGVSTTGVIRCRERLGGLLREYSRTSSLVAA